MLTTLLTSLLHSPQALISPPFFLLLLLACLLLACLLFLVLYLPWFNKGFPPLPFLQLLLYQHCTDTFCRAMMLTGSKTGPGTQQFCSFQARAIPWHREAGMAPPASAWEKEAAGTTTETWSALNCSPRLGSPYSHPPRVLSMTTIPHLVAVAILTWSSSSSKFHSALC